MKGASEITAESAEKITSIINQQTSATENVLITLKQIASGVDSFSKSTERISLSSENLKTIAEKLS